MKRHLKRLVMPESWAVKRKEKKFIVKPTPGPHSQDKCIPLMILLRDLLKLADNSREIKKIINKGIISVDGVVRKDHKFPLGIMDSVCINAKYYRVILNKKRKFELLPITKEKAQEKTCKIISKTILGKEKVQLNLFDGTNMVISKNAYKIGDSVVISNKKIKKHLKLEKGALVYIADGRHLGEIGKLENIKQFKGVTDDAIVISSGKDKIETLKKYAFVIENESDARSKD